MSRRQSALWVSVSAVLGLGVVLVRAATPPPISTVDIPVTAPMTVPVAGSVKDDFGTTWALNGSLSGTFTGKVTVVKTEPAPPPPGIVFGSVTETLGAVVLAKPSGWVLILHGSGFPTTGTLRLQVCGRIAPTASIVWGLTSIQFTVPPGPPVGGTPITGQFEIFELVNNAWSLKGRGGQFSILPDLPVSAKKKH